MGHCESAFEIHVTSLPARPTTPPISGENKAVIVSCCCDEFMAVMYVLRHAGGVAQLCPAGACGPITDQQRALGDKLLAETRAFEEDRIERALRIMRAPLN